MRHLSAFALAFCALLPIAWIVVTHDRSSGDSWFRKKPAQPAQPSRETPVAPAGSAAAGSPPARAPGHLRDFMMDEHASSEALDTAPYVTEAVMFAAPAIPTDPSTPYQPMLDRSLSADEKATELAPELVDAIVRIEGIYDPTRIGTLGPAFRMQIRPGTASMTNVFGDRWLRADLDPNVHYKVRTSAEVWLHPLPRGCEGFTRFRPYDGVLTLDAMAPSDCARIARFNKDPYVVVYQAIAGAPASVPIFAAPYAGGRFTLPQLRAIQDARREVAQQRLWFKRKPSLPVFFRPDPVTGRPVRRSSPIPPP